MSEETVFQRSDGRLCAKYKDTCGKWRYLYRKSKVEAKKALRQTLKDRDEGMTPPSRMTVGIYLDQWLEDMHATVSRRTWMSREGFVRNHIKPALGKTKLARLTADDVRKRYKKKLAEGLASSSVRRIHELLSQALQEAVRHKHIHSNPLDNVKPPKQHAREMDVLTPEQVRRLLDTVRGNRWEWVYVLGAVCGLRVGEALALRYEDLDLGAGTLQVRRTLWKYQVYPPKTPSSRRTLKLSAWLWKHSQGTVRPATTLLKVGYSPRRMETLRHTKASGVGVGSRLYAKLTYRNHSRSTSYATARLVSC
jgi:integrase